MSTGAHGASAEGPGRVYEGHAPKSIKHHFHTEDAPTGFHEFGGVGLDDVKTLLRQNIFGNDSSLLEDGFFPLAAGDEMGV